MNTRPVTAFVVAFALASGLTACGGDSADSSTPSTTAPADSLSTTVIGSDDSTTGLDSSPASNAALFDDNVVAARKLLDQATGDFCDVVAGTQGVARIGQASTPEQVQEVYALFRDSLVKMSDNVPSDISGDAAVIALAANQAYDEAKAGGFDPKTFNLQTAPPSMMTEEFLDAMSNMNATIETTCIPATEK